MTKAKSFKQMPTAHLMCRSLGHSWEVDLVTVQRTDEGRVYSVALTCLRCSSTRADLVPMGADEDDPFTLGRRYGYADGYVVEDRGSWGGASLLKRNVRSVLLGRLKAQR